MAGSSRVEPADASQDTGVGGPWGSRAGQEIIPHLVSAAYQAHGHGPCTVTSTLPLTQAATEPGRGGLL